MSAESGLGVEEYACGDWDSQWKVAVADRDVQVVKDVDGPPERTS